MAINRTTGRNSLTTSPELKKKGQNKLQQFIQKLHIPQKTPSKNSSTLTTKSVSTETITLPINPSRYFFIQHSKAQTLPNNKRKKN